MGGYEGHQVWVSNLHLDLGTKALSSKKIVAHLMSALDTAALPAPQAVALPRYQR